MSAYGCGRRVTIELGHNHRVHIDCGTYYQGELIQCGECQESKPAPSSADPDDEDAQAELEAERRYIAGEREEGNVP